MIYCCYQNDSYLQLERHPCHTRRHWLVDPPDDSGGVANVVVVVAPVAFFGVVVAVHYRQLP
jgi:hypothetical protein